MILLLLLLLLLLVLLFYCFMALCTGLPRWTDTRRNSHPLTPILIINHPLSAIILYLLPASIAIHGILLVQFTCLTVFLNNLWPSFLWSTSWTGIVHLILHTFIHSILLFAAHAHTIATSFAAVPKIISSNPGLSLNSLLGTLSFSLMPHIHLTASLSAEVPPHFLFLQARSYFRATCYFAYNCCIISLSLSVIHPYW